MADFLCPRANRAGASDEHFNERITAVSKFADYEALCIEAERLVDQEVKDRAKNRYALRRSRRAATPIWIDNDGPCCRQASYRPATVRYREGIRSEAECKADQQAEMREAREHFRAVRKAARPNAWTEAADAYRNEVNNNCDVLSASIPPYSMRQFSPANTRPDFEAAFRAQNDQAAFSVGRVPPSWPVTARDEECALGGIEQADAGIDFCPDDEAPDNVGYRWFTHRDAQRQRRPLHNARKDRDARSDARVRVHNSGASVFRVPADVLDRVTVDDQKRWALELLNEVCDEPPVYGTRWLRDEALDHLRRRTRRRPAFKGKPKPLEDHIADYTRDRVCGYARAGLPEELIARKLGLPPHIFRERHRNEIEKAEAGRVEQLADMLFEQLADMFFQQDKAARSEPDVVVGFEPVGLSLGWQPEIYTNTYCGLVAGRLFAEDYERKPRLLSHPPPGIDVGADVVCVERDLSLEELSAVIEDGSQPVVHRDGIVISLREGEPPKRELVRMVNPAIADAEHNTVFVLPECVKRFSKFGFINEGPSGEFAEFKQLPKHRQRVKPHEPGEEVPLNPITPEIRAWAAGVLEKLNRLPRRAESKAAWLARNAAERERLTRCPDSRPRVKPEPPGPEETLEIRRGYVAPDQLCDEDEDDGDAVDEIALHSA